MSYDFYAERYSKKEENKEDEYEYPRLKIMKIRNTNNKKEYISSIHQKYYYLKYQIEPNLKYIKWFIPSKVSLSESVFIKIDFTLGKPYISKDDEEFWPTDNSICKDKVFKIPYVRPSSWKGALRYVIRDRLKVSESVVERLFGNEKKSENSRRGRLVFYPTFLDQIDLDVIAPHDRKTKAGKKGVSPIYYEVSPKGSKGTFALLYFPFDLIGDEKEIKEQVPDVCILRDGIPAMLAKYGFGAKTSSGYGIVEDKISFTINNTSKENTNFEEFKKSIDE